MGGEKVGGHRIPLPVGEKGLARLGDAFVNLVYSTAKTKSMGAPQGEKVPDRVLSMALEISRVPVPLRLTIGDRGDIVEALLAYAWTNGLLGLDEAVEIIRAKIPMECFDSRSLEREAMAQAFGALFKLALRRIEEAGTQGEGSKPGRGGEEGEGGNVGGGVGDP